MNDGSNPYLIGIDQAAADSAAAAKPSNPYEDFYFVNTAAGTPFVPQRITYTSNGERQVTPGQRTYSPEDAQTAWENLKAQRGAIDALKQQMFWAGYYGTSAPIYGGDQVYGEDQKALFSALADSERNGGQDVFELVSLRAEQGRMQGGPLGSATSAKDSPYARLESFAKANGLNLSDNELERHLKNIGAGLTTVDDIIGNYREKYLANKFPAWRDDILAGKDVADIASPYVSEMSQLLELPDDVVNFTDASVQQALSTVGADGKPTYMPLWQFKQQIRKDPRWLNTSNAHTEISSSGSDILSMFGITG